MLNTFTGTRPIIYHAPGAARRMSTFVDLAQAARSDYEPVDCPDYHVITWDTKSTPSILQRQLEVQGPAIPVPEGGPAAWKPDGHLGEVRRGVQTGALVAAREARPCNEAHSFRADLRHSARELLAHQHGSFPHVPFGQLDENRQRTRCIRPGEATCSHKSAKGRTAGKGLRQRVRTGIARQPAGFVKFADLLQGFHADVVVFGLRGQPAKCLGCAGSGKAGQ